MPAPTNTGDKIKYDGQTMGVDPNGRMRETRASINGDTIFDDVDNAGRNSFNGMFGSQLVVHRNTYVAANFYYGVNTNGYINLSTNLGNFDFDGNLLRVNTGASANSLGCLRTKEVLRYRTGIVH